MFDSEEYIMDFEAEEERPQLSHFDLEDTASDCSTLSASEVLSFDVDDTTPPLFYKLKKARVLIKKLPQHVLAKYNISGKDIPSRSSGRIKNKHNPVGKYLALHKNKPLDKVINKKNRHGKNVLKVVKNNKHEDQKSLTLKRNSLAGQSCMRLTLKSTDLASDSSHKSKDIAKSKSNFNKSYLHSEKCLTNRLASTIEKDDHGNKTSSVTITTNVDKANTISSSNPRSLHERIATTRVMYKPVETSLPRLPDVVITRYNMPPASRNQITHIQPHVVNTTSNSMGWKTFQNEKPKLYCRQNVQSKVFPAFITPVPSVNQNHRLIMPSKTTPNFSNGGLQRNSLTSQKKLSTQALKKPNELAKGTVPIPPASPRIFVLDQSLLAIDPLNAPDTGDTITKKPEKQADTENTIGDVNVCCVDSDLDLEQTDAEKQIEPEVIKRIIYHTKSAQTKFTCNSSICGLVDSDEFNLNCFYCYEIFPLHKWLEFKEHIKVVHQVEEKANLSDSDIDNHNASSPKCSQNLSSVPKYMEEKDKQSITRKAVHTTDHIYNKLPLEPRILAQRQNKMIKKPSKLFSSTPKTPKTSNIVDQSVKSGKTVKFNNSQTDEVINLDSDDCDPGVEEINSVNKVVKKDVQEEKSSLNKKPQSNKRVNESKIILPSLPHITIKKVAKPLPKENTKAPKAASESTPNKQFIKIPSSTNIQKIIKTLPKTTGNQLNADSETKPRYFVVKKVIKLPPTDEVSQASDVNIPKGTILTKMSLDSKKDKTNASRASTNNIEDSVPKPTSGLGILFGLTNSMVVIEFLLKLKTFPELWRSQLENMNSVKYNESVKKLCFHLNNRFDLNMTEFEMLLSIQRVKDWYYLMLQSIHEHNKDPNNTEPYKHRFPIYFRILSQYLTTDVDEKGVRLNEIINKTALAAKVSATGLNEKSLSETNETNIASPIQSFKTTQQQTSTVSDTTPIIVPTSKDSSQNQEVTADSLIEFDADTLYDQSSDEETLEEFNESVFFNQQPNKKTTKADGTQRRSKKVYLGSFECDICRKVYKRNCDLKRHRVLHLPPQFECGRCLQKFYFKHRAERCTHVKNKNYSKYRRIDKTSGEKRIWPKKIFRFNMICEICGNSYRSIGSLNTHKKDKHFNQRNTCIVCNFTALSNWRIVQHQRKRHIVEPGLPEDVAKKSRARTESKTSFSNEARQAFDWRREMRKKMKPGEKFFGCCRCKIIFNTRKEKVLHNKIEHPITEYTVICLLCLPNKLLLSNSNCARRHYTDIHKVPWHEIDGLVKCTKPIFNLLSKEEIELLKASENYKELLDELLKDKKLQSPVNVQLLDDEASKAVQNLHLKELDDTSMKVEEECAQEQNVYVDSITDNDHYSESNYKQLVYASINEHNYSEENVTDECFNQFGELGNNHGEDKLYSQQACELETGDVNAGIESNDHRVENYIQNYQDIDVDFVEDELIEESLVVEEYIEEIIGEDEEELV